MTVLSPILDNSFLNLCVAKKCEQREVQDKWEDQHLVHEEHLQWEETEALINMKEDPDLQLALALSHSLDNGATCLRSTSSTPSVGSSTSMVMSVQEQEAWGKVQWQKHHHKDMHSLVVEHWRLAWEMDEQVWKQDGKILDLQQQVQDLQQWVMKQQQQIQEHQQFISDQQQTIYALQSKQPPLGTLFHLDQDQHRWQKGKMLTAEEKRAILHCLGVCILERALGPGITTKDPYLRTATYLGVSQNTIHKAVLNEEREDHRGKWRHYFSLWLMASDLHKKATSLNLQGWAATLSHLHKCIKATWSDSYSIPSHESICVMMCTMEFQYKKVGTTKNFVDTLEIHGLRHGYLKRWYLDDFKDALFVWLDESYCNQYHVCDKVCLPCILLQLYLPDLWNW